MTEQKEILINKFERFFRYETFILMGLLISLGALAKLLFSYDFSSDWFWFVSGIGLTVEGAIAFYKQRKFDKKYKVVLKE
jgi:hypothetical protein